MKLVNNKKTYFCMPMQTLINRRFRIKLFLWIAASLVFSVCGLYLLFTTTSFSVLGGIFLILGISFFLASFHYIESCFDQIDDFFNSVQSNDGARRYTSGLDLGESLVSRWNQIISNINQQRQSQQESILFYRALIDRVPVPLVIRQGETISLENMSAKHLFNMVHLNKINDLQVFGETFLEDLNSIQAGERISSLIKKDNAWIQVSLAATKIYVGHNESMLISIDPIQQELDKQELESWQNLVRVFTHEIMNSMTPIRSLSQTAKEILAAEQLSVDDVQDVKSAVDRVGNRAEHLMKFVRAYRKISEPPLLQKTEVDIMDLFSNIKTLMNSQLNSLRVQLDISVLPEYLSGYLDSMHMEQLLINLVQNSLEALGDHKNPRIILRAYLNHYSQLVVEVEDNGIGIKPAILDKLFTPFFTSKTDGTGIGLFLAKQIVLAHDGNITALNHPESGAILRITF